MLFTTALKSIRTQVHGNRAECPPNYTWSLYDHARSSNKQETKLRAQTGKNCMKKIKLKSTTECKDKNDDNM